MFMLDVLVDPKSHCLTTPLYKKTLLYFCLNYPSEYTQIYNIVVLYDQLN